MHTLRVISGPREGEQIDLDGTVVVGRHDADVVIDDPELSRRHLEIQVVGDGLIVEDLGSTNGTFVDQRQITAPTHLRQGDRFRLGSTTLEVKLTVDPDATRLRPTPDQLDATRMRPVPSAASELAPDSAPAAHGLPAHAPAPAVVAQAPQGMGTFRPPAVRRGVGLASRSWVPVALSFGTVLLAALALIVYFAQR